MHVVEKYVVLLSSIIVPVSCTIARHPYVQPHKASCRNTPEQSGNRSTLFCRLRRVESGWGKTLLALGSLGWQTRSHSAMLRTCAAVPFRLKHRVRVFPYDTFNLGDAHCAMYTFTKVPLPFKYTQYRYRLILVQSECEGHIQSMEFRTLVAPLTSDTRFTLISTHTETPDFQFGLNFTYYWPRWIPEPLW